MKEFTGWHVVLRMGPDLLHLGFGFWYWSAKCLDGLDASKAIAILDCLFGG